MTVVLNVGYANNLDLQKYNILLTPPDAPTSVKQTLMSQLVNKVLKRCAAFDSCKTLLTNGKFPFSSRTFTMSYLDEDDGPKQWFVYYLMLKFIHLSYCFIFQLIYFATV